MLRPPSYQYMFPFESAPMNSRSFCGRKITVSEMSEKKLIKMG